MKDKSSFSADSHTAELNYNKLSPILKKNYGVASQPEAVDSFIEEAKTFEKVNNNDNEIIGLFHMNDFTVSYLSTNASKKFKCSQPNGNILNNKGLFYALENSHQSFPHHAFEWIRSFTNDFTSKGMALKNSVNYFCGVKLLDKNGEVRSYFIRQYIRTHCDLGRPCTCVFFLTDISHLYKADFYWTRMVRGRHKEITAFKNSKSNKEQKDILTVRERQILQLISAKKESKEISSILNISLNTVDSHRKNMIKRSGAENTTALIQLCKMAGLL